MCSDKNSKKILAKTNMGFAGQMQKAVSLDQYK